MLGVQMVAPGDAAGTAMPPAGLGEEAARKQPGVFPQNLHHRAGNAVSTAGWRAAGPEFCALSPWGSLMWDSHILQAADMG